MSNDETLIFFNSIIKDQEFNEYSVKMAKDQDYSCVDANFIMQYSTDDSEVLDLGSGTGLIVNKLFSHVKRIVCVELYTGFTDYIIKDKKIEINNINIFDFTTNDRFDLVTAFGIMHYFNKEEALEVYSKYKFFLKDAGYFIIKNQFGLQETITIENRVLSDTNMVGYYSQYRSINSEIEILRQVGFQKVQVVDIYPPFANKWSNTHYYALVCQN
ncbi:hypothetical protein BA918_07775 [Helicobacter pullorum]|uniref:methyltransferase domain-containing protein n=1 Tax=Helicobacter pullorum TaxID=35818 RepID=UPI000816A553|nr:methyltransferase domain-containing protein [Helicobacter pullorum]OCR13836.1 hypothetical protein BA919_07790 [Helicobacter pullorum]OCR18352.1 hypothetical protein BA918_07775 [Helicobacter pullorum]